MIVVRDVQQTKAQVIRTAERLTIVQDGLGAIMQDAARVGKELDAGVSQTNIGIEAVRAQVNFIAQSIESARREVGTGDTRIEVRLGSMLFDAQRTATVVQQTQGDVREVSKQHLILTGTITICTDSYGTRQYTGPRKSECQ